MIELYNKLHYFSAYTPSINILFIPTSNLFKDVQIPHSFNDEVI